MLKVYRSWMITPINDKTMIAQKGRMTFTGEYEDLIVKIDHYEYEQARKERANDTKEGNIDPESRD